MFIKVSVVKTASTYTGQSYKCSMWMAVSNLWAVFSPPAAQFDLLYRTVGKSVFVLSAVCISGSSAVTTECAPKPKEILFMCIIAKEQALNYCTSVF